MPGQVVAAEQVGPDRGQREFRPGQQHAYAAAHQRAAQYRVLGRRVGRAPVAQQSLEDRAEPLLLRVLDEGAGVRVEDEREVRAHHPRVVHGQAQHRVDGPGEPVLGAGFGCQLVEGGGERLVHHPVGGRLHQQPFAVEVVGEQAAREPGPLGDVGQRGAGVSALVDQLDGGPHDAAPGALAHLLIDRIPARCHRVCSVRSLAGGQYTGRAGDRTPATGNRPGGPGSARTEAPALPTRGFGRAGAQPDGEGWIRVMRNLCRRSALAEDLVAAPGQVLPAY